MEAPSPCLGSEKGEVLVSFSACFDETKMQNQNYHLERERECSSTSLPPFLEVQPDGDLHALQSHFGICVGR